MPNNGTPDEEHDSEKWSSNKDKQVIGGQQLFKQGFIQALFWRNSHKVWISQQKLAKITYYSTYKLSWLKLF